MFQVRMSELGGKETPFLDVLRARSPENPDSVANWRSLL